MNSAAKLLASALLLILGSRAAAAEDGLFQPRPDEFLVIPIPFDHVVLGVPISAQAQAFLALNAIDDKLRINVRAVADLSDLQRKIGSMIDAIPLPKDNCAHFGADNIVAEINRKEIVIEENVAILELKGRVEDWDCSKAPPCSKLDRNAPFPFIVFFECNPPIKLRLLSQPFTATLPFSLTLPDSHTVAVRLGQPSVDLGGNLGGVLSGVLRIAGVDLNGRLKEILDGAINPSLLKGTLPEKFLRFNPVITRGDLLSNSGALAVSLEGNVALDDEALAELIVEFLTLPQSGG